jgi:hypothetical protein
MKTKTIQFRNITALLFINPADKRVIVKWFNTDTISEIIVWPSKEDILYRQNADTCLAMVRLHCEIKNLTLWSY